MARIQFDIGNLTYCVGNVPDSNAESLLEIAKQIKNATTYEFKKNKKSKEG